MKKASNKQKYACKLIYNHINEGGNVDKFIDNLTTQEAFLYIKNHKDIYENLSNKATKYDNAFYVTDWLNCCDLGICPWGNS